MNPLATRTILAIGIAGLLLPSALAGEPAAPGPKPPAGVQIYVLTETASHEAIAGSGQTTTQDSRTHPEHD